MCFAEPVPQSSQNQEDRLEVAFQAGVIENRLDQHASSICLFVLLVLSIADDLHRALEGATALGKRVAVVTLSEIIERLKILRVHASELSCAKQGQGWFRHSPMQCLIIACNHSGKLTSPCNINLTPTKWRWFTCMFLHKAGHVIWQIINAQQIVEFGHGLILWKMNSTEALDTEDVFKEIEEFRSAATMQEGDRVLAW